MFRERFLFILRQSFVGLSKNSSNINVFQHTGFLIPDYILYLGIKRPSDVA
jgi:hypothetical protein